MPKIDLSELYKPHDKQVLAHTATEKYILYGGAFGGGKTIWLVNEAIQLSLDYPGNIGYLCRHELPAFKRSVLIELERYIHPDILEQHHQTSNYFKFKNGSYIYYGGLGDDTGGLARLSSMTLGWFGIDQAEETTETHFNMLAGRLRLKLPGLQGNARKALCTCNPAPGWVKQKWVEQQLDNHVFIQSLPKDNPFLPEDYEPELRKLYPPEWVKAMLEGDWSALEGGNFLFRYNELRRAVDKEIIDHEPLKWAGFDIAREGDDSSVAIIREGSTVIHVEEWMKSDLMQTTGRIQNIIDRFEIDPSNCNLDAIGLGAGVLDRLKELNVNVNAVIAGGEPMDKEHYINSRAEMYDNLRKRFEASSVSIPEDRDLIAQCSSIRFKFASDKKLQIVSKEDMKRQFRVKSPDKADALALCFYEPRQYTPSIRWL